MPERRISYEVVGKGQQNGIQLRAPSAQRLFIDAALAACDYRVALDLVKEQDKLLVSVEGTSITTLFHRWLGAVAALYGQNKFLPSRIVFTHFDTKSLKATLTGETYVSSRHGYARPFHSVLLDGLEFGEVGSDIEGEYRGLFYFGEN
jgi:SHS2 domain-containing protein